MTERPSLDELVREVSPDKLDQPCRDEDLCKIAPFITDWQATAPYMGFSGAEEREIMGDCATVRTRKIAMLRMWRTKYGINATYRRLVEIFWDLELTDLITKVCDIINSQQSNTIISTTSVTSSDDLASEQTTPYSLQCYQRKHKGPYHQPSPTLHGSVQIAGQQMQPHAGFHHQGLTSSHLPNSTPNAPLPSARDTSSSNDHSSTGALVSQSIPHQVYPYPLMSGTRAATPSSALTYERYHHPSNIGGYAFQPLHSQTPSVIPFPTIPGSPACRRLPNQMPFQTHLTTPHSSMYSHDRRHDVFPYPSIPNPAPFLDLPGEHVAAAHTTPWSPHPPPPCPPTPRAQLYYEQHDNPGYIHSHPHSSYQPPLCLPMSGAGTVSTPPYHIQMSRLQMDTKTPQSYRTIPNPPTTSFTSHPQLTCKPRTVSTHQSVSDPLHLGTTYGLQPFPSQEDQPDGTSQTFLPHTSQRLALSHSSVPTTSTGYPQLVHQGHISVHLPQSYHPPMARVSSTLSDSYPYEGSHNKCATSQGDRQKRSHDQYSLPDSPNLPPAKQLRVSGGSTHDHSCSVSTSSLSQHGGLHILPDHTSQTEGRNTPSHSAASAYHPQQQDLNSQIPRMFANAHSQLPFQQSPLHIPNPNTATVPMVPNNTTSYPTTHTPPNASLASPYHQGYQEMATTPQVSHKQFNLHLSQHPRSHHSSSGGGAVHIPHTEGRNTPSHFNVPAASAYHPQQQHCHVDIPEMFARTPPVVGGRYFSTSFIPPPAYHPTTQSGYDPLGLAGGSCTLPPHPSQQAHYLHAFPETSHMPPYYTSQMKGITFPFHSGIPGTSTGHPQLGQTRIYYPYRHLSPTTNERSAASNIHGPLPMVAPILPKSPLLESYANYLRQRYQTRIPTFFTLDWPPAPTRRVFNLALTQERIVQYNRGNDELVRLMLLGDVRGILDRKREVKLEEICDLDSEPHKIILIEGAPGAGKSTLAWHICQKWGLGQLFQEFDVVIYIQLRDPATHEALSLTDILPARSKDMAKEVASEIKARNGCQTLLVIDSWDEYPPGLHHDSLFRTLICNRQDLNMDFSAIIITSRPIATGDLQQFVSSRVEIVGFTPHELKHFTEALRNDSQAVKKLQEHLRERPVIEASCYLPLNAAIVAHLFLALGQSLPTTLHGVFTSLVICCIIRHMKKEGIQQQAVPHEGILLEEFVSQLSNTCQQQFFDICTLAYHGVMENKATFVNSDLQRFKLLVDKRALSLIQGSESITIYGQSILYNFLHLSIQELLAAFCISKMPPTEQVKIFKQLFEQPRFAAVFQFYAAFTKLQTEGVREIVAGIVRSRNKHQLLSLLQCLYEAQDPSLCQFVASQLNRELELSLTTLSPVDCLAVGYFMSEVCFTTSGEFKVSLWQCSLGDYKLSLLVKGSSQSHRARDVQQAVETEASGSLAIDLMINNISHEGAHSIAELLSSSTVISKLDLSDNPIEDKGVINLCKDVMPNSGDSGVLHISSTLETNTSLKELNLERCGISGMGAETLASVLAGNATLETLNLRDNPISDSGVSHVAEALRQNHTLKDLNIWCCGVTDQGVKSLASALAVNATLETLNLSENTISDSGVSHVAEALRHNHTLKDLYIWDCGVTNQGMKSLASALKLNTSLKILDLSWNEITDSGLKTLGESLQHNRGLEGLELQHLKQVTAEGLKMFVLSLQHNSHLRKLYVDATGGGAMSVGEETAIVNQMRKRKHLSELIVSNYIDWHIWLTKKNEELPNLHAFFSYSCRGEGVHQH